MDVKEQLHEFCQKYIDGRMTRIQNNIKNIQDALTAETKSSAGDKHETGRAMLQLEREKLGQQLMEVEKMAQVLSRIPIARTATAVAPGSWVKTAKADYFLAISAGEFMGIQKPIFCISVGTPIGQLLLGKSVGERITFNTNTIEILEIA